MPLHDWNELTDWETVHTYWIADLGRWLKPRLPAGYRVSLAAVPALVVAPVPVHPDVIVRRPEPIAPLAGEALGPLDPAELAPDQEVALATIDTAQAVQVTRGGNLIAVIELVSPRNKDRPETRRTTTDRFIGYLSHGVHLLMVDVQRRPLGFSFADDLATALLFSAPAVPAPCAVSYRMGGPAPEEAGQLLAMWRRPLTVGAPLPTLPLPLSLETSVWVDLEQTYMRAAADAYLA
jgi:hypothetical protein